MRKFGWVFLSLPLLSWVSEKRFTVDWETQKNDHLKTLVTSSH